MFKESKIKVASVQHPPVYLNLNESIELAKKYIDECAGNGANLISFPETWLPGYPIWLDVAPNAALWDHKPAKELFRVLFENSIEIPGKQLDELLKKAKDNEVIVIMGAHERAGGTIYNSIVYINSDGSYKIHRKLMPTYTERLIWGRGDGSTLNHIETKYGNIGGLICWEHWMPLARNAMHEKQETIHIAQWPQVKEMNQVCSRHYAFEGQCYVIASGVVVTKNDILEGIKSLKLESKDASVLIEEIPTENDEILMHGNSVIYSPDGSTIVGPLTDKKEIIYAELDLSKIIEGRLFLDSVGHYSRPDVFEFSIKT